MKRKIFCAILTPAFILCFALSIHGEMASEAYRIPTLVTSSGGTAMVSGSYNMDSTLGGPIGAQPSSQSFELYSGSQYSLWNFLNVQIEIKPGDDSECINNNDKGVFPVAIFSNCGGFDATLVDPNTVKIAGLSVKTVGKKNKPLANVEDVNKDGCDDLVVQIEDTDEIFQADETEVMLTGYMYGGIGIFGTDYICFDP